MKEKAAEKEKEFAKERADKEKNWKEKKAACKADSYTQQTLPTKA